MPDEFRGVSEEIDLCINQKRGPWNDEISRGYFQQWDGIIKLKIDLMSPVFWS